MMILSTESLHGFTENTATMAPPTGQHWDRDQGTSAPTCNDMGSAAHIRVATRSASCLHWHMSGPHFRDYHLLLDEQAEQLFAMTDPIAERIRKVGGRTTHGR